MHEMINYDILSVKFSTLKTATNYKTANSAKEKIKRWTGFKTSTPKGFTAKQALKKSTKSTHGSDKPMFPSKDKLRHSPLIDAVKLSPSRVQAAK